MEFTVLQNNMGYAVQDRNQKLLYSVRKKTFGRKWNLIYRDSGQVGTAGKK